MARKGLDSKVSMSLQRTTRNSGIQAKGGRMNLDRLDHVIRLLWMLIMTVWLGLASESNEPVEVKRDKKSDVAVWIVSIGWIVLLLPRFNGPQLLPRIMFIRIIGSVLTI